MVPIQQCVVTAEQMRQIEGRLFAAGMPVAALMEKVAQRITTWLEDHFDLRIYPRIGVVAGPGHNGGDALVVARELHSRGYDVRVYAPLAKFKDLTQAHAEYIKHLGILWAESLAALADCDLLVDGLFGFGLERPIEGAIATDVEQINQWSQPVVSIDLPSGLHTDSGNVLGTAIRASHTLCLGLWKRGCFQDSALPLLGRVHLIDFDIPWSDIEAVLGQRPQVGRITAAIAREGLPLPRLANTHKYRVGHLLLVAGSQTYSGAALLAGLGARASGVGMVTLAVPASLKASPDGLPTRGLDDSVPRTPDGAIAQLPDSMDLESYDVIACGPGLSLAANACVQRVIATPSPLLLDADGLNILATLTPIPALKQRSAPTLLTPHPGEFKRLFKGLEAPDWPGSQAQAAAHYSQAIVVLKGARTVIAHPRGHLWLTPDSTPALARGGSGDILTGLLGGLAAQKVVGGAAASHDLALMNAALSGVWWHAQAGRAAAAVHSELGVDPLTLLHHLTPTLVREMADAQP
ncbi:Bifunctional NAD(P)H-hydrate repair enzyme Nnr [Halomicronema hongdechloris C2206]|uniref:Bifunctional NAD(P)H-hydrate repair enzyme n=1 Tax=Halomicronema hongdechloris C2206 TaxID=1641165 RepID=A0A1Z3HQF5_9CYAN|nr:NAD(P)H-hydrate dehydratase [Halomicronema hongdechloris]ASC72528.1 Bifunctional NAD(P)H-hydrate repair enzyme Nnr [Halomicronema hongdechloris C2206]